MLAFLYGTFIVVRTLVYGDPVAGYPSLVAIMLFLGGIQLTAVGVLGEYIGRIFDESKQRPLYFVNSYEPAVTARLDRVSRLPVDQFAIQPAPAESAAAE